VIFFFKPPKLKSTQKFFDEKLLRCDAERRGMRSHAAS